ncbi:unnamed protein product [Strongylus vulgaris]|uniref:Uncharacterized protein n=1 Tax=Strongylus vulgaris TaxID=40348 RepID=A0A3P7JC74_STRVU|nr:unnamed protein product [Strongylus vulgaris]
MVAILLFSLALALTMIPQSLAFIRAKRHSPSQSLQHYFREKRQQSSYYNYGSATQGQSNYYPQYSYSYPAYSGYDYSRQPSYGSSYYSQYPQYQQYPTYDYSNYYNNYYSNYYRGYGTSSYYQQPSSGGMQRDRWGNSYMMLGNFKLNIACKSRGCPGK